MNAAREVVIPPPPSLLAVRPGETVWTVPWAVMLGEDRRWYLNPNVSHQKRCGLVSTLRVTRTETGWVADVSRCEFDWKAEALPPLAPLSDQWQPVQVLGQPRIAPYLDP